MGLGATEDLEPGKAQRLLTHLLPHWIETVTVSCLRCKSDELRGLRPEFRKRKTGAETIGKNGIHTLWQHGDLHGPMDMSLKAPLLSPRHSVCIADNGMVYLPMARNMLDQLLAANTQLRSTLDAEVSQTAFAKLQDTAEEHGKPIYEALVHEHQSQIARERKKDEFAFAARSKAIERIGLPQVRNFRLNLLSLEKRSFREQLDLKAQAFSEMVPQHMIRVEGSTC